MLTLSLGLAAVSRAPWATAHPPNELRGLGFPHPAVTAYAGRPAYLVTAIALLLVATILACAVTRRPIEYGSALVLSLFALAFSIGVAIERVKWSDAVLNPLLQLPGPGYRAQGSLDFGAITSLVASGLLVALAVFGLVLERRQPAPRSPQ
jgi:hypothetical protein